MIQNRTDKQALLDWEEFRYQVANSTSVDPHESEEDKKARIKKLEADPEAWFKYYFPKYTFAEPADFHKKSTKKVLNARRLRQARRWFRGSAKSTRRMFEVFYKMLVQKFRTNCLLISKTYDNAERLLAPYIVNLDSNQRIINDYGIQEKPGSWTSGEFVTRSGAAFRAVGAEQNPRGTRLEELRVTVIIFDDVDDDEVCRNPDRVRVRWDWIERAVIPTVDIAGDYLIFFDNNLIAEVSCTAKFCELADDVDIVHIRDAAGKSSWPEKNSEKDIDDILNTISWESAQQEYFDNPLRQGTTFREITWGKCPAPDTLPFLLAYSDPATSNKDKPLSKSRANNSCKSVALLGYKNDNFYLYSCFVDNTSNDHFIDWMYAIRKRAAGARAFYNYIENNTLQDPFYQQVLLPLVYAKGKENGSVLQITPDTEKKPEKWFRIEATLEPLVRMGRLIFNIDENDNEHMKRMEQQFLTANPNSRTMDGPDCIQGGIKIIQNKIALTAVGGISIIPRPKNKKRY